MRRSDTYSWRVEPALLDALKAEAARRDTSVARLLEGMARAWLEETALDDDDDQEARQARLAACVGAVEGSDPDRASNASRLVRERLRKRGA